MSECPICGKELYGGDNVARIVPPYSSRGYGYHLLCLATQALGDVTAQDVVNRMIEFVKTQR